MPAQKAYAMASSLDVYSVRVDKGYLALRTAKAYKKSNEIGIMVGYKDPHYFSYLFKKTQGVTPTQFRSKGHGEAEE